MPKQIIISVILIILCLLAPNMVQAAQRELGEENTTATDRNPVDPPEQNTAEEPGVVTSIDAMLMGKAGERSLATAAAYCVESEQYDKAIKLSRRALDKNDDDNEIHQVYAEALEGKLTGQVEKDPALFNQCIQEWLIVLRQERGDEKLSYHGLSIPGMGKFYEDEDRVIPARKHLMKLAGSTPKVWETDAKYLRRVTAPGANNLYGKVISHSTKTTPISAVKQSD